MCLPVCVPHTPTLPNVTVSGYVDIDNPADNSHGRGAKLFYALYEVAQPLDNSHDVPVLLWLQARALWPPTPHSNKFRCVTTRDYNDNREDLDVRQCLVICTS